MHFQSTVLAALFAAAPLVSATEYFFITNFVARHQPASPIAIASFNVNYGSAANKSSPSYTECFAAGPSANKTGLQQFKGYPCKTRNEGYVWSLSKTNDRWTFTIDDVDSGGSYELPANAESTYTAYDSFIGGNKTKYSQLTVPGNAFQVADVNS